MEDTDRKRGPFDEHDMENPKVEAGTTVEAATADPTVVPSSASQEPCLEGCDSTVEIKFQEDRQPEISRFHDHFTLLIPSSTIRYREGRAAARVLEANDAQFVLEETYNKKKDKHSVSIRRIHDTSEGVRFLRVSYAIVTAFWTGFLFVFCLQILLFLFLDLAIQAGATSKQPPNWGKAIGSLFLYVFLMAVGLLDVYFVIGLTSKLLAIFSFFRSYPRLSWLCFQLIVLSCYCWSVYSGYLAWSPPNSQFHLQEFASNSSGVDLLPLFPWTAHLCHVCDIATSY